jgi:hypothetical protein
VPVAGQNTAVVRVSWVPFVRLAVYVHHDGVRRLQSAVPCNKMVPVRLQATQWRCTNIGGYLAKMWFWTLNWKELCMRCFFADVKARGKVDKIKCSFTPFIISSNYKMLSKSLW